MKLSEMKKLGKKHPLTFVVIHGRSRAKEDLFKANTSGGSIVFNDVNPKGTYSSIRPT